MAIFLDSASVQDARQAAALGFVSGATTNPGLLAQAGGNAAQIISEMIKVLQGPVFYQLNAPTVREREVEAQRMVDIHPYWVGLKIPCSSENLALLARLSSQGITCAVTTIFSSHQAYLTAAAGARYLIPYVNRSTRLLGSGPALLAEMAAVLKSLDCETEILAASIKSPAEAVEAVLSGAHHLTLPLELILAMGEHPLSNEAIQEWRIKGGAE